MVDFDIITVSSGKEVNVITLYEVNSSFQLDGKKINVKITFIHNSKNNEYELDCITVDETNIFFSDEDDYADLSLDETIYDTVSEYFNNMDKEDKSILTDIIYNKIVDILNNYKIDL